MGLAPRYFGDILFEACTMRPISPRIYAHFLYIRSLDYAFASDRMNTTRYSSLRTIDNTFTNSISIAKPECLRVDDARYVHVSLLYRQF